ncbi:hypothetical protein FIM12_02040, partial [SAR202 cluster bacterium AD-804-J14_MRT_500m]|nr:hypothetical protein [SAR202 cluster bacterium AD-804-J14_MRT_500m]
FNANLTEEHNVLGVPIKRAVKNGTRLIVIDPREVELTRHADLWLRPKPGTELILLAAILKEMLDQGLERREWLEDNVLGVQGLRETLASFDIKSVSEETGVPTELLDKAVRMYAPAEPSSILYALDNINPELHDDVVQALLALSLLTGNLGSESAGLFPLRRGANEQGAWDVGCVPDFLPGYKAVSDSESLRSFSDKWAVKLPSNPGLDIHATFEKAASGQIKAMFVVGDNSNFSNGELGDASAAFKALEFLVVQDSFLGTSAQYADVVFPRLTFAEKSGTYTNLERRIQLLKPVIRPRNNSSRSESTVFSDLAKAMNATGFDFDSSADVMDEIAGVVTIYGGVSHSRLENEGQLVFRPDTSNPLPTQILYSDRVLSGLQWPCVDSANKGTPILYADGFPNGKARINSLNFRSADLKDLKSDSFIFTPGRVLLQENREVKLVTGTRNQIERDEVVELHREDAAMLDIEEGDLVEVQWVGGEMKGIVKFQDGIQRGVVASTSLFGKLMVELDKSSEPDPMSKVPELTVASAQLVKLPTGNSQKR